MSVIEARHLLACAMDDLRQVRKLAPAPTSPDRLDYSREVRAVLRMMARLRRRLAHAAATGAR